MILHHAGYGTLLQPVQCIVVSAWCLVSTVLSPGQLLRVEAEGRAEVSWLALDRPREGVQLQDRVAHSVLYCTVLRCTVLYCTCSRGWLPSSPGFSSEAGAEAGSKKGLGPPWPPPISFANWNMVSSAINIVHRGSNM